MQHELHPPAIVRCVQEDLARLAAEICRQHEVADKAMRQGLQFYCHVGEMLLRAKEACGHGNWLTWIEENIPFTPRQAQKYMRLALKQAKSPAMGGRFF